MKAWSGTTPENSLDLLPISKLIATFAEANNADWSKDMPRLKEALAISFASEPLAGTGW